MYKFNKFIMKFVLSGKDEGHWWLEDVTNDINDELATAQTPEEVAKVFARYRPGIWPEAGVPMHHVAYGALETMNQSDRCPYFARQESDVLMESYIFQQRVKIGGEDGIRIWCLDTGGVVEHVAALTLEEALTWYQKFTGLSAEDMARIEVTEVVFPERLKIKDDDIPNAPFIDGIRALYQCHEFPCLVCSSEY